MNDCLLESENFQITKSDNNKYLLLPVKKQQQFVLKECGKDFDNRNLLSLTHTHKHISFLFSRIKFARKTRNYLSPQPSHTFLSLCSCYMLTLSGPAPLLVPGARLSVHITMCSPNKKDFRAKACCTGWSKQEGAFMIEDHQSFLDHQSTLGRSFHFFILIIDSLEAFDPGDRSRRKPRKL